MCTVHSVSKPLSIHRYSKDRKENLGDSMLFANQFDIQTNIMKSVDSIICMWHVRVKWIVSRISNRRCSNAWLRNGFNSLHLPWSTLFKHAFEIHHTYKHVTDFTESICIGRERERERGRVRGREREKREKNALRI